MSEILRDEVDGLDQPVRKGLAMSVQNDMDENLLQNTTDLAEMLKSPNQKLEAIEFDEQEIPKDEGQGLFSFQDEIKPEMFNSADKQRKNDKGGKKYFYYVYSGNFPHHIENALKKRGVWKQFDKSAQETKFQLRNFNALSPLKKINDKHKEKVIELRKNLAMKIQAEQENLQKAKSMQKYALSFSGSMVSPKSLHIRQLKPQHLVVNRENPNEAGSTHTTNKFQDIQNKAIENIKKYEAQLLENAKQEAKLKSQASKEDSAEKKCYSQNDMDEAIIDKCQFVWKPFNYYEKETQRKIDRRLVRQNQVFVFNHFEVLKSIGTKSGLIRSLKQFYYTNREAKVCGYSVFDTTPTTFLVQSRVNDDKMQELVLRFKQLQKGIAPKERMPMKHCANNIWLVKPTNMN